jgi:hypothetical protein
MSLLDELKNATVKKGPACQAGTKLTALPKKDKDDLLKAFREESVPATIIQRVLLDKKQIELKLDSLRRHLKGECSCESF